ncbi:unnamed protein product [Dibothriocephalus latus]|uniref:Reverse transcriptase domain-containing protein n=1 Tax=Dibothriocephalus latus TaxID=60516 RepID=A0A3P6TDA1_DIBLA|nr:unnamed protein product [Dibothriocephalus latus]
MMTMTSLYTWFHPTTGTHAGFSFSDEDADDKPPTHGTARSEGIQLAIDVVKQPLTEQYDETPLKSEHLLELLRYCLKTYFTSGGQMYEQIKGTPMGFPLSGLIAKVALQRTEQLVFTKYQPKFWARYVDDTFIIIQKIRY